MAEPRGVILRTASSQCHRSVRSRRRSMSTVDVYIHVCPRFVAASLNQIDRGTVQDDVGCAAITAVHIMVGQVGTRDRKGLGCGQRRPESSCK